MKFVSELTELEISTLEELQKNHLDHRSRVRAHSILLSNKRFKINDIAKIQSVDRDTVSIWIDNWEQIGIVGLFDDKRCGRPPKLTEEEQKQALDYIKEEPRSVKSAVAKLEDKTGKRVSSKTLKRLLKKGKHIWKRVRTSLKGKRDQAQFEEAKQRIKLLEENQRNGKINLYYLDGACFSLTPKIPYAWQEIGNYIELPSARSGNINVLGLFQANGEFDSMVIEGTVNSDVIIGYFNHVVETLTKPTWIIMDNAPTHKSAEFTSNIESWESKGLHLYFLPPYSPELNLIEILWRFIKYQWMPFSAYLKFDNLKNELNHILANIGKKYQITFG